jgi:titin
MWPFYRSRCQSARPARRPSCRPTLEALEGRLAPATFTVSTTNDAGAGSLRQAILDANATPGADLVAFNIAGAGVHTISLTSGPLPTLTDAVSIDGTTQPGFAGTPLVELNGAALAITANGLTASAGGNTIQALAINRFGTHGILLLSANNAVRGCFLGTNAAGTAAAGNGFDGVVVLGASGNVIGGVAAGQGNVISGNGRFGVDLLGGAAGNLVAGNRIGTDAGGITSVSNGGSGVFLNAATGNTVGGTTAAARNIISGNLSHGVLLQSASGNVVEGNYIGTNPAGTSVIGNVYDGVACLNAGGNVIGGTAGAGNLIGGNSRFGVDLLGTGTSGNAVQDNFIGTNASGSAALPNSVGVTILFGAASNSVFGNLVSGNFAQGVLLASAGTSGNAVQGNWVGLTSAGSTALANSGDGVEVAAGATGNLIGGPAVVQRNVISGNGIDGVVVAGVGTTGNNVQGNFIGINAAGTGALGNAFNGITLQDGAASDGVFGNVIGGNHLNGVEVRGPDTSGHLLQGNLVGILPSSTAVANQERGVVIRGGATGNRLVGNVVSGNHLGPFDQLVGVEIRDAGTTGNVLAGNFVGLNLAGSAAVGNGFGVEIDNGASGNLIGGLTPADRNVISGNSFDGVTIVGAGTNGNVVEGNFIGTNVSGTAAVLNSQQGVSLFGGSNNVIGGTTAAARNLISGNNFAGVEIDGPSTGNVVQGNFIGTNALGTAALANLFQGVTLETGATGNTISGNVISGNGRNGVLLSVSGTTGNVIQGNQIGTTASGAALGNGAHGVFVTAGAASNTIRGNVIANNRGNGVLIGSDAVEVAPPSPAGSGNAVLGNLIFANGRLGIDLGANDGVTSNDAGDSDHLQNYPLLTRAILVGDVTLILGSLNTAPQQQVRIEFFSIPAADASASAHGQALVFLGFVSVVTDRSGNAAFNAVLPAAVPPGHVLTATATTSLNGTSEFSNNVAVG